MIYLHGLLAKSYSMYLKQDLILSVNTMFISDPGYLNSNQSPSHKKSFEALFENSHHEPSRDCEHSETSSPLHHSCHNILLRHLLLLVMLSLLALGVLLAWSCINWHSLSNPEFDNLMRRESWFSSNFMNITLNNLFSFEHSQ